jgi:ABC-type lipoprotein export system ATPase subunit
VIENSPPSPTYFEICSLSAGPLRDFSTTIKLRSLVQLSGESGSGKTFLCRSIETENFLRFPASSSSPRTDLVQPVGTFRSLPIVLTSSLFDSFSASSSILDILQLTTSLRKIFRSGTETDSERAEAVLATLRKICAGELIALGVTLKSTSPDGSEVIAQSAILRTERVFYEERSLLVSDLAFPLRSGQEVTLIVDRLRIEEHQNSRILAAIQSVQQAGYTELKVYKIRRNSTSSDYKELTSIPCGRGGSPHLTFPSILRNSSNTRNSEELLKVCRDSGFSDALLQSHISTCSLRELLTSPVAALRLDKPSGESTPESFLLSKILLLNVLGLGEIPLATGWNALSRGEQLRVTIAATIQPHLRNVLYLFDEPLELLSEKDRDSVFSVFTEKVEKEGCTVLLTLNEHIIHTGYSVLQLPQPRRQRELKRGYTFQQNQGSVIHLPVLVIGKQQVTLKPGQTYAFQETALPSPHLALSDIVMPQLNDTRHHKQSDLDASHAPNTLSIHHDLHPYSRFRTSTTVGSYLKVITPLAEIFAGLPSARERGIKASAFVKQRYLSLCLPGQPPLLKGFRFEELLTTSFHDLSSLLMFHPLLKRVISWLQRGGLSYLRPDSQLISLGLGERNLLRLCKLGIRAQPNSIVLIESPQLGLDMTQVRAAMNLISCMKQNGMTLLYSQSGSLPDLGADNVIVSYEDRFHGKEG